MSRLEEDRGPKDPAAVFGPKCHLSALKRLRLELYTYVWRKGECQRDVAGA